MPFISYAQNFEDVMLWRALKHIEKGCYVDVGAQHPIIDSVSKAFYERGWRGIHIEPVPAYAQMLRQDRPDETVLEIALSDSEGILELNVIPETGLSTAVAAYAQQHHATRGFDHQCLQVTSTTLNAALAHWAGKEIHWLKIDAEGLEGQILKGWDSTTLRPWIIVIEATIPGSSETDHAAWEPLLDTAGYQFAYFDGLNRFYLAPEHTELAAAFAAPPNVFDDIHLTANSSLCLDVFNQGEARTAQAEARAAQAEARAAQAEAYIRDLINSRSWRITRPLRQSTAMAQRIKTVFRLGKQPSSKALGNWPTSAPPPISGGISTAARLSPRAARLYAALKQAISTGGKP